MNLHFSYGQKLKKLKCTYNDPYNEIILKLKTQQKHGFLNLKFQFRKKKKKVYLSRYILREKITVRAVIVYDAKLNCSM